MNFISYVEKLKTKARMENLAIVRQDIEKADVKDKINSFIERWPCFTIEQVKEQILTNDLVAAQFAKDPAKQNISEKAVISLIGADKKVPASGKNCIRFTSNGEIVHSAIAGASKSVDFVIDGIYYTQKYTMEAGGAQDNQYHDVIEFLEKGSISHKVGAIVDGWYWENGRRDTLIDYFKNNPNVVILSMDDIKQYEGE